MSIAKFLGAHPNVYISSIPNSSLWSSYKFFVKFWKVFLIKGKHKFEAWLVTCDSKNQRLDKDLAIAEDCNARHGLSRHLTLWTRIAQNVKKPSLTVNVINFRFFCHNVSTNLSIWVSCTKKSWCIGRIIQIPNICGKNKVHFAPFLRFHWNPYIVFPDFSDVWPSRG